MTPADDPILICSLPQSQPEPASDMGLESTTEASNEQPPVKEPNPPVPKKAEGSKRRSRRVQLRSSGSDEEKDPEPASKVAAGTRMLPATFKDPKMEEKTKDLSGKIGSCSENPPPTLQNPIKIRSCSENPPATLRNSIKEEKGKNLSGKTESYNENPAAVKLQDPIKEENGKNLSGKAESCNENPTAAKLQDPIKEKEKDPNENIGSSDGNLPVNLLDVLRLLTGPPDMTLEDADILDIAAMKGIHIAPPRWHRPSGYDIKPKKPQ